MEPTDQEYGERRYDASDLEGHTWFFATAMSPAASQRRQGRRNTQPMHDPEPAELRVLGCLIEKQRTTPDVYPLSLNSLRAACNQSTNRDPVVDYDEADDPRRAAAAQPPRLGAARERPGQPRGEVPAPVRRGARPRRRRDLACSRC